MGFSWQEDWSGLPFTPSVDHILSELSTETCPSWVALHGMAYSLNELHKPLRHDRNVVSEAVMILMTDSDILKVWFSSVQLLSHVWLCDPMDCSTPGLSFHHQLLEFIQTHAHWVGDAIQPSHLLSSSSPPACNVSQHQGLFKWVSSSYWVAKVLEFPLQHQSY